MGKKIYSLEKKYQVVLISATGYTSVFKGTKPQCKQYKKDNRRSGNLAVQYYDNARVSINSNK